jgi:hypothetical protein
MSQKRSYAESAASSEEQPTLKVVTADGARIPAHNEVCIAVDRECNFKKRSASHVQHMMACWAALHCSSSHTIDLARSPLPKEPERASETSLHTSQLQ